MPDAYVSLIILGCAIVLFVWNRLPVGAVAIITALGLLATGVIDADTAVAGFGDPVVIFIATLFVLSEGLEASGITAWAGQLLMEKVGTARTWLLVAVMVLAAVMAALVTPNGAAAALLPVMVLAARRAGLRTSQMAMPLAFAASGGALLALSGSTVNVIVSDTLEEETGSGFGFFEFAIVGLPLVLVVIALAAGFGRRLLPDLSPTSLPDDFSTHLDTLVDHYRLDSGFFRLHVSDSSDLVRTRPTELHLPHGVRLIGVQGADGLPAGADQEIRTGDVLVVTGPSEGISGLATAHGLTVTTTPLTRSTRTALLGRDKGVAEVVVPPRSPLIGQTFFPGLVRSGVTVLAVRRLGKDKDRPVALTEGDMLLLHGTWAAVESLSEDADVLVVDSPEQVRRQTVALGATAWRALAVLAVTVALLATGAVSPAVAGLIGATGMVLTRVVGVQQAYRSVSWQTVVLVGGLIPLSVAIQESGAADLVADLIVGLVGGGSPHLLLVALFVLTGILGQVISNTATVLIVTPIAVSAAAESGIALAPVLMLVAVAGAASFLTPIATPANMIVMGPGGYRFGDYWKLGLVTMAAWLVVAVLIIPVVWPFA